MSHAVCLILKGEKWMGNKYTPTTPKKDMNAEVAVVRFCIKPVWDFLMKNCIIIEFMNIS